MNEGLIGRFEEAFNCKVNVLKTEKHMKLDIIRLSEWLEKQIEKSEGDAFDAYVHVLEQITGDPQNYDEIIIDPQNNI